MCYEKIQSARTRPFVHVVVYLERLSKYTADIK